MNNSSLNIFLERIAFISSRLIEMKMFLSKKTFFSKINYTTEVNYENLIDFSKPKISYYFECELKKELDEIHTLAFEIEILMDDILKVEIYSHWIAYDGLGRDVFKETLEYNKIHNFNEKINYYLDAFLQTINEPLDGPRCAMRESKDSCN